ncbi:TetR/AcrR family transcriptional regulator [Nocardiopsis exhalans]|uniref:AcrR family transcriptional regulator n=2 Tax=Nocardiopsis TaxID=2013 RepID=A0A840W7B6_9ACTN|nr:MULTISPECIES: TetR/AcrR family transcriptional regulator [Nocardiopsis]MBB5491233.1 AcrR family transcriptional regulator [Nocardiopsis metallicus]USY17789.1 TetR/AcrR family transcriptional regulator [Nocardiopsis exhalans]
MVRLSRVQQQERNRARVLTAAREEFAERGFRDAKIDRIADRAELTRGAVYSNFPGKRALYLAVLAEAAEAAERAPQGEAADPVSASEALGAFARAWVARLPLTGADERMGAELTAEVTADPRVGRVYAQLTSLQAVLVGLALERLEAAPESGQRRVRVAESVLTTLHGAGQLAVAAPGFTDPFTVIRSCERLAGLDLDDSWPLPHIAHIPAARPVDEPWSGPSALDVLHQESVRIDEGVVVVLGLHRLEAVEEALRAAPEDVPVTIVPVTAESAELLPLVRLVLAELRGGLSRSFPARTWARPRIVLDSGLAAAAGAVEFDDDTEIALRLQGGRIVARSQGRGAAHAVAAFSPEVGTTTQDSSADTPSHR